MKKKILYVDMDGVIADFEKEMKTRIPNLQHLSDEERNDKVDQMCLDDPNIFHNLSPIEGSIEIVKKLFDKFEVYFLSTPMWLVPESFAGKRLWLEEHFGELAVKRLILSHRKDLNIGDYLIDDRTHNGAGEFTGEHIHYGTDKFPDWESVYTYLTEPKDERIVGLTKCKCGKPVSVYAVESENFEKDEVLKSCEVYGYEYVEMILSDFKKLDFGFCDCEDKLIQIRLIEHNDHEGETFSYVMMVTPEIAMKLKELVDEFDESEFEIEIETTYTKKDVENLNQHVDNDYMEYINFYELRTDFDHEIDIIGDFDDIFYKASGLKTIE